MSEEREPIRLRDDPKQSASLRGMFDAAISERPDDAMLERVLAGVLASGGGGGGGGGGGAPAKASLGASAAIATAVVVALTGVAVWATRQVDPPPARPTAIAIVIDASAPRDAPTPLDAADAIDSAVIDASIARHVEHTRAPPPPSATPTETDGALMLRATREHDPARSLALAEQHRAQFPDSPMTEERQALIVNDLAALDRADDARAGAARFRARWPHSAHLPRIDAALARMVHE